jgi:hypothetical protein
MLWGHTFLLAGKRLVLLVVAVQQKIKSGVVGNSGLSPVAADSGISDTPGPSD